MRLWTLHPRYLDPQGLVALWREGLLAQKVLAGNTRGYRHPPQLRRFQACDEPLLTIGAYLAAVADEAERRGYRFDRTRLIAAGPAPVIEETTGQLRVEREHLRRKLTGRNPGWLRTLAVRPRAHPLFRLVRGPAREWEKAALVDDHLPGDHSRSTATDSGPVPRRATSTVQKPERLRTR